MSPEQWDLVKELYEEALECDSPHRADFLLRKTTDPVVRDEVLRLLAENENVGSFLSTPPLVNYQLPAEEREKRFPPGEMLSERFRIVSFIAAGGMGEVYEAEDLALKENLAIKTIRPEVLQQNNALARFKREVQLARKVTHPNICRVFDLVWHKRKEAEGESVIVFVSMELLQGETLSERIRRGGRFTAEEALPLINQIASGLEAAHRAGVVHRDLKPGNVILVPDIDENQIRCVITDFGLALRTGVDANKSLDLSATHGVFGTPAYMAPEQIEGKEVTKLTDIYGLGLIIYEMVTGEHAFPADTPLASVAKRLSDPVVSPKRFAPELTDVWEQTIVRCLQREPNARYSSAMDVAKALSDQKQSSSDDSQVRVDPRDGRLARVAFPLWRNKFVLGMGSFFLLCVILAVSFYAPRSHSGKVVLVQQPLHKAVTFLGAAYTPAISPDGKFAAFVTRRSENEQKLMLQALSGGPSLELLRGQEVWNPRWAPDGSEIMVRVRESNETERGLFFVSHLGGPPRPLGMDYPYFCWSSDGSQIVAAWEPPESGIWIVNKQTGLKKQLSAPGYRSLLDVDCVPKTGMLLLLTKTSDKYQIWTMKPDGSEQRKLIEEQKEIVCPRWSSTADAVYYLRAEGNTTDLVKISASGKSMESSVLVSGLESGDYFTLSADDSQLVYTRTQNYANLWLAELPKHGTIARVLVKPISMGTLSYNYPSISPDGRWVAFAGGPDAKSNIYKMTLDGGQPVQLTFFDAARSASPGWSPDGQRIAFICDQGGKPKVWVVNAEGGTAHPLEKTNASATNNGLAWFPSPEIVYQQPGQHNLRRLNVETQEEEPVLPADSEGWLWMRPKFSPDGKKFAVPWNRGPDGGLWVVNLEKYSERLLLPGNYWALGWSRDGKLIYAGQLNGREIVQIELENPKHTKTIATLNEGLLSGAVSPNGRQIIVSLTEEKSDVWLMKNFDPQANR